MSNESFPGKELLEVIRGQARMEEKLDNFLKSQSDLKVRVDDHDIRIATLESKRTSDKAYVAGAASVAGLGMGFLVPYLKSKLGI